MHNVVPSIIIPVIIFIYGVPLRFRSIERYARKFRAIIEGIIADASHAVGNCNACNS